MQFHPNELLLLYNPQSSAGKQVKAMALDICKNINEIDILRERISPTYWKEIVTLMGKDPEELLDHSHEDYRTKVAGNAYTMNGWLDVLAHYPHLVKAPIAIYHGKAVLCATPTDVMKVGGSATPDHKVLPHLRRYAE